MPYRSSGSLVAGLVLGLVSPGEAAVELRLQPLFAGPGTVGEPARFLALSPAAPFLDYRWSVRPPGEDDRLVRDFYPDPEFELASLEEGLHVVTVTARHRLSGETVDVSAGAFLVPPRNALAAVSATSHPLLALYSAPPCAGGTVRVAFRRVGTPIWQRTPAAPCLPGRRRHFYVAGMVGESQYVLRHEVVRDGGVEAGPALLHATGAVPPDVQRGAVSDGPDPATSLAEGVLLFTSEAIAIDLWGRLVWYYDEIVSAGQEDAYMFRPTPDGTFLLTMNDSTVWQILREIDVAGNTVRETNARRVAEQLIALGHDPVTAFHHDALRLPNGHTLVLGSVERIVVDQQGPGPVDVLGDMVVDLDEDLQVVWAWNAFDHLDVTRQASMGEICEGPRSGCPEILLAPFAKDWTHTNSIALTAEGDILLSSRNQDWVLKIDYDHGRGSGALLWKLGEDGDFTLETGEPDDWFSHQHDAQVLEDGSILLYDNSDLRCHPLPRGTCSSRGQRWVLDEQAMTATPVVNIDVGNYSPAVGNAQLLANGNYLFFSGMALLPIIHGQAVEFSPDGTPTWAAVTTWQYRAYRMPSLYGR